jgi:hypothetical protein
MPRFILSVAVGLIVASLLPLSAEACMRIGVPTHKIAESDAALPNAKLRPEQLAEIKRLRDNADQIGRAEVQRIRDQNEKWRQTDKFREADATAQKALDLLGVKPVLPQGAIIPKC